MVSLVIRSSVTTDAEIDSPQEQFLGYLMRNGPTQTRSKRLSSLGPGSKARSGLRDQIGPTAPQPTVLVGNL